MDLLRTSVDEAALAPAIERNRTTGEDLASACLSLGLLSERELVHALSLSLGFPGIDLSRSCIPVSHLGLVPPEVSRGSPILVVAEEGRELLVALADPGDSRLLVKLRAATGRQLLPHVAVAAAIERAQEGLRAARLRGERSWTGDLGLGFGVPPGGRAEVVRPAGEGEAEPAEVPIELVPLLDSSFAAFELPPPPRRPARAAPRPSRANLKETLNVSGGVGAGKVALVVDDTEALRRLLCSALKPFGLAIVEAADGKRALELAREAQPDLVILDAMLPEMHGFEVCRAIKGDPALRSARVLMVSAIYTGWRVAADVQATFGADAFLEKPFRIEELQKVVRGLLLPMSAPAAGPADREEALRLCRSAATSAQDGATDEALSSLRRAAELDPYSAEPHLYLGQLLRVLHQPYQAVAALERAVELRPDLFRPLAELAVAYELVGFRRTAREVYARALEVCQEPPQAELIRRRLEALAAA